MTIVLFENPCCEKTMYKKAISCIAAIVKRNALELNNLMPIMMIF